MSVQEDYLQRVKTLGQSMDILHSNNLYGRLMLDVSIVKNICIINNIHDCNFRRILH